MRAVRADCRAGSANMRFMRFAASGPGLWVNCVFERVGEMSGMLQRCDFDEHPGLFPENDASPDMDPSTFPAQADRGGRQGPLEAFLDSQTPLTRAAHDAAQGPGGRGDHMERLASKVYWDQLGNRRRWSCVPAGRVAFSAALQQH